MKKKHFLKIQLLKLNILIFLSFVTKVEILCGLSDNGLKQKKHFVVSGKLFYSYEDLT